VLIFLEYSVLKSRLAYRLNKECLIRKGESYIKNLRLITIRIMRPNLNGISDISGAVAVGKTKTEYIAFCKNRRARLRNAFSLQA